MTTEYDAELKDDIDRDRTWGDDWEPSEDACPRCGADEGTGSMGCECEPHADYPHEPGRLYDCAACESECFCTGNPGDTECVFCALSEEN